MSWYLRRARILHIAADTEGYGTPTDVADHHIGRVVMQARYGPWRGGFYPVNHREYAAMERHYAAKHKKRTMELPK